MIKIVLVLHLFLAGLYATSFEKAQAAYDQKVYTEALRIWIDLAQKEDLASINAIGHMYNEGLGVERDRKKALYWFNEAAKKGFNEAQYQLGMLYLSDEQTAQALYWLKKSAEDDHAEAQMQLAQMYSNGEGVLKSERKAYYWYKRAAELDVSSAQVKLASLYCTGKGVAKNIDECAFWVEEAQKNGHELTALRKIYQLDQHI